jgi:hypothetical protein
VRLTWTVLKVCFWLLMFLAGFWTYVFMPLPVFALVAVIFVALLVRNRWAHNREARTGEPEPERPTDT